MSVIMLPRLSPALTITSDGKTASPDFRAYWQKFCEGIERQEQDMLDALTALQAGQIASQAAIAAANNAAASANNAASSGSPSAPQKQFAAASIAPLDGTWQMGPSVRFPSAVSATPSFSGSGVTGVSPRRTSYDQVWPSGSLRLVKIVGSTTTVLSTVAFTTDDSGNVTCPPFTYSGASPDGTTGAITYRIDAERTDGAGGVALYLNVVRTP